MEKLENNTPKRFPPIKVKSVDKKDPNLQPSTLNVNENPWEKNQRPLTQDLFNGRLAVLISRKFREPVTNALTEIMGRSMAELSYQAIIKLIINVSLAKRIPFNYGRLVTQGQSQKICKNYPEFVELVDKIIENIIEGKNSEQICALYDLR